MLVLKFVFVVLVSILQIVLTRGLSDFVSLRPQKLIFKIMRHFVTNLRPCQRYFYRYLFMIGKKISQK